MKHNQCFGPSLRMCAKARRQDRMRHIQKQWGPRVGGRAWNASVLKGIRQEAWGKKDQLVNGGGWAAESFEDGLSALRLLFRNIPSSLCV